MKEQIVSILNNYHQEHILNYYKILSKEQQDTIEKQILDIDFEQLHNLYETTKQEKIIEEKKEHML